MVPLGAYWDGERRLVFTDSANLHCQNCGSTLYLCVQLKKGALDKHLLSRKHFTTPEGNGNELAYLQHILSYAEGLFDRKGFLICCTECTMEIPLDIFIVEYLLIKDIQEKTEFKAVLWGRRKIV